MTKDATLSSPRNDLIAEIMENDWLTELQLCTLSEDQRDALIKMGVPPAYIDCDFFGQKIPLLTVLATYSEDGQRFNVSTSGKPTYIFSVYDQAGNCIETAGWQPNLGTVAFYQRLMPLLGAENLSRSHASDGLLVHSSVLNWIRFGRQGLVILDFKKAVPLLWDAGPLIFEDAKQARAIRDASTLKNISVMKKGVVR